MIEHDIEFKNPIFHSGLNVTVRSGKKWLKAMPGDELQIFKTGEKDWIHTAHVVAAVETTAVGLNYNPFPLQFEHSPGARTFPGLAEEMAAAYGECWTNEPVVILYFWA